MRDTGTLIPHPDNPNKHTTRQIQFYKAIIQYQGWRRPIVISKRSGYVTKGHGALMVAQELGLKQVPVDLQDYANEDEERADLLADNKLPQMAEMDFEQVAENLRKFEQEFDLTLTSYTRDELDALLSAQFDVTEEEDIPVYNSARIPPIALNEEERKRFDKIKVKLVAESGNANLKDSAVLMTLCDAFQRTA